MSETIDRIIAIIPAAGVGKRMGVTLPKQYLTINHRAILSHTLNAFLSHPNIDKVVVAIGEDDPYFKELPESEHPKLLTTIGGKERADSVLSALKYAEQNNSSDSWVLVHDAARPCITHDDIDKLLDARQEFPQGAILAIPVRDTMKRAGSDGTIDRTVCREQLWHAMTPQMFQLNILMNNLERALSEDVTITDEASAMEWANIQPGLVSGRPDNIKVTHKDDLPLAELYLKNNG
ncbi:2-C-methyl-D-erythritol 4-phosphate cytidylyltransferase [Parashewanella curva]|uniref:2-C-methyl-D-erythritol 4-phosphate cytidylyltransferase n=1 Tax=Parashewanella curva TaxID=2338552 RepID=A0A3L8Q1L9_9GAMM|nr:2-C-methyl-D-erythritol 4-phosphate cytidylyltransferase [Parashewanella curva]RLV61546.1 2-C-methyl-D-erythritol 4-phosphate cytidylyltransferase [Parashewanella curva]